MFCEQCGKQIKDDSAFCGFCGTQVRAKSAEQGETTGSAGMARQDAEKTPLMQARSPKSGGMRNAGKAVVKPQEKKRKKKGIFIGAAAGLLIGIAAALVVVYVSPIRDWVWGTDADADSSSDGETMADSGAASDGETMADSGAALDGETMADSGASSDGGEPTDSGESLSGEDRSDSDGSAGDEEMTENGGLADEEKEELEAIDALAAQAADYLAMQEVLEQYADFAEAYSFADSVSEQVKNLFPEYQSAFLEHIEMLEGQDVSAGLYLQMEADFTGALELSARLSELGIAVDTAQIEEKYAVLPQTYRERYISAFIEAAEETRNENGVVSRSALWSLMDGADQLDFYDQEDFEDSFKRCYTAAFVLQIDSEMESLSDFQAGVRIYEVMADADYSPLLIYYLAERTGDTEAIEWRNNVQAILESYGYDFFARDIIGMRNFIYEFGMDGSEQAVSCRSEIREYMQNHFSESR